MSFFKVRDHFGLPSGAKARLALYRAGDGGLRVLRPPLRGHLRLRPSLSWSRATTTTRTPCLHTLLDQGRSEPASHRRRLRERFEQPISRWVVSGTQRGAHSRRGLVLNITPTLRIWGNRLFPSQKVELVGLALQLIREHGAHHTRIVKPSEELAHFDEDCYDFVDVRHALRVRTLLRELPSEVGDSEKPCRRSQRCAQVESTHDPYRRFVKEIAHQRSYVLPQADLATGACDPEEGDAIRFPSHSQVRTFLEAIQAGNQEPENPDSVVTC